MKSIKNSLIRVLTVLAVVIGIYGTPITALAGADNTAPTINAAINNGKLTINAYDESGIKVIYVNDFEFLDPKDGQLVIRLEKFDAGNEKFVISAMDNAGNRCEDYVLDNPYWTDPNADNNSNNENPADSLPADASASDPNTATGEVTDHDFYYLANNPDYSREFYQIQTESGKTFYLIIENEEDDKTVHFLTYIDENDLLNTTDNNSQTLPKNSLGATSSVPVSTINIPNEDGTSTNINPDGTKTELDKDGKEIIPEPTPDPVIIEEPTPEPSTADQVLDKVKNTNPLILYGVLGVIFFIVIYYFKIVKKKKNKQDEMIEDEEAADEEEYLQDSESEEDSASENDYFDRSQSNEEFFDNVDPDDE